MVIGQDDGEKRQRFHGLYELRAQQRNEVCLVLRVQFLTHL